MNMIHKHTISFKHAIDGLIWALKTQPNYRIHIALSLLSFLGCYLLPVSYFEFLIILVLIFGGMTIETINTALENTSDAITKEKNPYIKLAKDVAAGAMLMYAIGAFLIACIIFIPKIIAVL